MTLATYGLESGPLGYRPLREFLSAKLKDHAAIACSPDEILITSGSLQGLDPNACSLTTGAIVAGTRSITARYLGDAAYAPATSAAVGSKSQNAQGSSLTRPAGITPGQRANAACRRPPS